MVVVVVVVNVVMKPWKMSGWSVPVNKHPKSQINFSTLEKKIESPTRIMGMQARAVVVTGKGLKFCKLMPKVAQLGAAGGGGEKLSNHRSNQRERFFGST